MSAIEAGPNTRDDRLDPETEASLFPEELAADETIDPPCEITAGDAMFEENADTAVSDVLERLDCSEAQKALHSQKPDC